MRIAVVSDVHANLHALEAVLAEVDKEGFDEMWCLGDVVGYGPKPNECVALLQGRTAIRREVVDQTAFGNVLEVVGGGC